MAGNPMQFGLPPLLGKTPQAVQYGSDESHLVAVVGLMQDWQGHLGVNVGDHRRLRATAGVLKGMQDGHQFGMKGEAVARCPYAGVTHSRT